MKTEMQEFWQTRDHLLSNGSFKQFEAFLEEWQNKMKQEGKFLDWASVTNEKGLFYRKIGWYEKSIKVMDTLRKALLKERGRHSPEYASLLNNLAGTYRQMGRWEEAIALFKESIAIYQSQARINVSACASLYLNLSQAYQESGQMEEAACRLEESLRYLLLSGRRKDIGQVYYQLSLLYYQMNEPEKTDVYIKKALDHFRAYSSEKNPYYAVALNGLGGILYQKEEYEEAARVYREAAQYLLKFYGRTHEYAINRQHESWALQGMGRLEEAYESLREAGEVCKGLYGSRNEKVRAVYDELKMLEQEIKKKTGVSSFSSKPKI
jgi:tetratricopeptide (TPR) repeat protein